MKADFAHLLIINYLGVAMLTGIGALACASIKGSPIDVSVVGVVTTILGAFSGFLTARQIYAPAPKPPDAAPGAPVT